MNGLLKNLLRLLASIGVCVLFVILGIIFTGSIVFSWLTGLVLAFFTFWFLIFKEIFGK